MATDLDRSFFVGRQAELKRLGSALDRAAAGRPQLVIVWGEPGIGKSALVRCFGQVLASRGVAVHRSQCQSIDEAATYSLVAGLVRSLIGVPRRCSAAQFSAATVESPGVTSPRQAAMLGQLLGVDVMDAAMRSLSGQQLRTGAFMAFNDLVAHRAAEGPLVLSAGDLQWSDDASLDWLTSLFERIVACDDALRLLITCELRPDQRLGMHHMGDAVEVTPIQLGPLARDVSEKLALAWLGPRRDGLPPSAWAALGRIVDRSGGNPQFLLELLGTAEESGELPAGRSDAPVAGAPAEAPPPTRESPGAPAADLPDSVRAAAALRLDKLAGPVLRLVQVAAVLGRRFEGELLEALNGPSTRAQLAEALKTAILESGEDGRLSFRQAEFQEVVYERMPPSLRRLLHQRAGETLEAAGDRGGAIGGPTLNALAHHFAMAQDGARAQRYLSEAGDHARAHGDNARARNCYEAALDWSSRSPGGGGTADTLLSLAIVLGDLGESEAALDLLERRAGSAPETPRSLRARAEILRRQGSLDQALANLDEALEAGANADEHALLLAGKSDVLRLSGDFKDAIALAKQAIAALAARGPRPATEGYVHSVLGICHHRLGQLGLARLEHAAALKLRETAGDIAGCAISLNNIATIDVQQGRWEQAEAGYRRSLEIARRLGDRRSIITALENLGDLLLSRGEEAEAERHFRESLRLARETGSVGDEIIGIANLATLRLAMRDGPGALQEIEASWSLSELSDYAEYAADLLSIRGRANQLVGDLAAARRNQEHARRLADGSGNASLVAIIDRHIAELDAAEGKQAEALERALRSEEVLRKATLPLERGRTLALLARLAPAPDRDKYFLDAADLFESLGARRDLLWLVEQDGPNRPVE